MQRNNFVTILIDAYTQPSLLQTTGNCKSMIKRLYFLFGICTLEVWYQVIFLISFKIAARRLYMAGYISQRQTENAL